MHYSSREAGEADATILAMMAVPISIATVIALYLML